MAIIVINTDSIEEKHVAYFTRREGRKIFLHEVVEVKYVRPDYSGATISNLETRRIDEADEMDVRAPTWVLLEAAQRAVRQ